MAWFDRNPSSKKSPVPESKKNPEAPKPPSEPAPVVATSVTATPAVAAPEPKPAAPKIEVPPPAPASRDLVGHLYKGSRVSGQISFQGPARIDGAVDGEIHCQAV